jgi:hypothetical protein
MGQENGEPVFGIDRDAVPEVQFGLERLARTPIYCSALTGFLCRRALSEA